MEYPPPPQTITSKPLGSPLNVRPGAGRHPRGTRRHPATVQAIWACGCCAREWFRGAALAGRATAASTAAITKIGFIASTFLVAGYLSNGNADRSCNDP